MASVDKISVCHLKSKYCLLKRTLLNFLTKMRYFLQFWFEIARKKTKQGKTFVTQTGHCGMKIPFENDL
jgi:hypothetical protein